MNAKKTQRAYEKDVQRRNAVRRRVLAHQPTPEEMADDPELWRETQPAIRPENIDATGRSVK